MSIASEITRIQNAKNTLYGEVADDFSNIRLDDIADVIDSRTNRGTNYVVYLDYSYNVIGVNNFNYAALMENDECPSEQVDNGIIYYTWMQDTFDLFGTTYQMYQLSNEDGDFGYNAVQTYYGDDFNDIWYNKRYALCRQGPYDIPGSGYIQPGLHKVFLLTSDGDLYA